MVDAHNGVPLKLNSLIIVCGMKEKSRNWNKNPVIDFILYFSAKKTT